MSAERPFLSLALLAYQERQSVEEAARACSRALEGLGRPTELVLVDDGSTDGTREKVAALADELPRCRAILHPGNLGIAAGVRTCFFETAGEWATWFPADLQADPAELPRLVAHLDSCDVLVTHRDTARRSASRLRRAVSGVDRLLVRALFGLSLRDLHWIRFFRRKVLDAMQPVCASPALDTEMVLRARALGARILEVPLADRPRRHGRARGMTPASAARATWELFSLRLGGLSAGGPGGA